MKKILTVLAVCLAAGLFVTSCAAPGSGNPGSGAGGSSEPEWGTKAWAQWILTQEPVGKTYGDPEYDAWLAKIPDDNCAKTYNITLWSGNLSEEFPVYFRMNNVKHTDKIELVIVENTDNINLQVETIWEENDTDQWLEKYGNKDLNPNIYFKIKTDKLGTVKFYVKDVTIDQDFGATRWGHYYTLNIAFPSFPSK